MKTPELEALLRLGIRGPYVSCEIRLYRLYHLCESRMLLYVNKVPFQ